MKIIALLFFCLCLRVQAQTYVNYPLTSFPISGGRPTCSITLSVPTNTIIKIVNAQSSPNVTNAYATLQYPGQQVLTYTTSDQVVGIPVLGPATIQVIANATTSSGNLLNLLVEYDTVNTSPNLVGYAVQPNGHTATITLQSSADLKTWQTATNGTRPATNRAEFYRLNFVVQ